jgi:ATP-binding cassette subfamily A (ABC1) protein 3
MRGFSLASAVSSGAGDEPDNKDKPDLTAFEEVDASAAQPYVIFDNLTRVFGRGRARFVAVDHLSMFMHERQVTALLGHNGAGKSTTVHMLTGMLAPTSGTALVGGFDLRTQLSDIRRLLGVCPQYNVLFDKLTVAEHLYFFCRLKGAVFDKQEAADLLAAMDITSKKNAKAGTLSGGMKRKLSVGVALIGNSQLVVLDEPTSGIDASARHEIWRLLQREKRQRTILLTTHYMEEADVLADRIAIMATGKIQCAGSPLFLKQRYGAGYHLTLMFDSENGRRQMSTRVLDMLRTQCTKAALTSVDAGAEATFLLPAADRARFSSVFAELEKHQRQLQIQSFGVSITSMEEVFITVGELAEQKTSARLQKADAAGSSNGHANVTVTPIDDTFDVSTFRAPNHHRGVVLFAHQLQAMLRKRAGYMLRAWWSLAIVMLIPMALLALSLSSPFSIGGGFDSNGSYYQLRIGNQSGTSGWGRGRGVAVHWKQPKQPFFDNRNKSIQSRVAPG